MLNLPPEIMTVLMPFAPLFHARTWQKVPILLIGTILTPGKRTVTAALRVMGLKDEGRFSLFHQVLNRASWSSLAVGKCLLDLLIRLIYPADEPLVFGIDETIERRWGEKIATRGIYRDPVRSSDSHFVKASGLRWISLMLLTPIPWAQRIWALPVMTVIAPSERYYETRGRKPKTLTERAQQMIKQLRRWVPNRALVMVGDNSYAALDLLAACQTLAEPVTMVTRLRMDAALYEPAPPYPGMGRPPRKGARLPTPQAYLEASATAWTTVEVRWYDGQIREMELASATAVWFHYGKPVVPIRWVLVRDPLGEYETTCLLCTDQTVAPLQIVEWFVMRWQVEVTYEEARRHLGVETQRQWSDKAIARTTPALLGLFAWITLVAHVVHLSGQPVVVRQSAWYAKSLPTFSDALALVRYQLWFALPTFQTSGGNPDLIKVSPPFLASLVETLCYAA
jgi:hypothetical protein